MELRDPVSCLLCLDAFERPTMLRVQLRPIGGGDPHEHLICSRCGGAIAAEYLYVQETLKSDPAVKHDSRPAPESVGNGNAEIPSSVVAPIRDAGSTPAAAPGEAQTVGASVVSTESPRRRTK
jgi:hypothetical protein